MDEEDRESTYSIWWFVAAFLLIGAIGLVLVLRGGADSPTVDVGPKVTLPAPTTAGAWPTTSTTGG